MHTGEAPALWFEAAARDPAEAAAHVLQLARRLDDAHRQGRLGLAIFRTQDARTWADLEQAISNQADREFGASAEDREWLPSELRELAPLALPVDRAAAERRLQAGGVALDPQEIDIYQLGAILCRALTADTADAYRRSAKVKSKVPVALRPVVEGCLRCDGRVRFKSVGEVIDALTAAGVVDASQPESSSRRSEADRTTRVFAGADLGADTSSGAERARASTAELPFSKLGGYDVLCRLGSGGMGDVYKAYEPALDRVVALKVLPAELARQPEFVQRFQAEAMSAAKLVHPHIVPIFRIGTDGGHHFFAMQFVDGESLAQVLARRGRMPLEETLSIVEQVLSALSAAHAHGLVHRDVKPGNIFLDRMTHRALLGDFGLVKSLQMAGGPTATGVVLGTLEYLAPEQGRGHAVDGRADLYSIGVLLYRMLAGQLPFDGSSPTALIFQHVYEPPPPLRNIAPDVPSELEAVVLKLLAKSPSDRFATADEVLQTLRRTRPAATPENRSDAPRGRAPTRIVMRPTFPENFPENVWASPPEVAAADRGWRARLQDHAATLFRRHAPDVLKQLQNTQQIVDGAIGEYERRQRRLETIEREAAAVLAELKSQAAEERTAARNAVREVERAAGAHDKDRALEQQLAAEQSARELEGQAALQDEQLGGIRLQLAQVQATLQRLRTQRDVFQARMKVAQAKVDVLRGGASRESKRRRRRARLALIAGVVVAGMGIVWALDRFVRSHQAPSLASLLSWVSADVGEAADADTEKASTAPPRIGKVQRWARLSADGRTMVNYSGLTTGDSIELRVWDLRAGRELRSLEQPHRNWGVADLTPDGKRFLSYGSGPRDNGLRLWDVDTGKVLKTWRAPDNLNEIRCAPDNHHAYALAHDRVHLVDLETLEITPVSELLANEEPSAIAVSPADGTVAIANRGFYSSARKAAIDIYSDPHVRKFKHSLEAANRVDRLRFSRDGSRLIASVLGKVVLYRTSDWSVDAEISGGSGWQDLALTPDNAWLVSHIGQAVHVYNVRQRKLAYVLDASDVQIAPNGVLVVQMADRFHFLEAATGNELLLPGL